ncbi:MAG: phosphoribosylamine--glycine ligase [Candidatus Omnitrophica bacterium]|nr:phosphoribosylamine--glycine ligase [Candidatus Omnitrophota bacterium]
MQVLVIGSGGREHALCRKLAQSKRVDKIFCAPGNGGISQLAECVDIKANDVISLLKFANDKRIDLTVVGPEVPLVAGIVDTFTQQGHRIFGPDQYIAQLEGSKVFSKKKMAQFGIPTAGFKVFEDAESAKKYIREKRAPLVIKADGLCAGKGVMVALSEEEALSAVDTIMVDKSFGTAGDRIIIEDCLEGEEASVILVTDGRDSVVFASSQDHKRAFDNDKGPNTGGMGAYSPAPVVTEDIEKRVESEIVAPLMKGLAEEKTPYKGVLYLGLMIVKGNPYVLEFNVRFGDPETQAILPRLKTDLVDIIEASIDGRLKDIQMEWDDRACVCVVCASGGYPGGYKKGLPIHGLDEAAEMDDVVVFHAGTKATIHDTQHPDPSTKLRIRPERSRGTTYETSGGRVLGVTGLGEDIKAAIDRTYAAVSKIDFKDIHYRKDIGYRAVRARP